MLYEVTDKFLVVNARALRDHLRAHSAEFYVYVLCYPTVSSTARPFYVGIGQGKRIFAHELEAKNSSVGSPKVQAIREIQRTGSNVLRVLDGVHEEVPWRREQELISLFGLAKDGAGILLNEQQYSPSFTTNGIELRKYAMDGNELPNNFIRRNSRLKTGPRKPKSVSSVYGKIYAMLEAHRGVTGAELVELLLKISFVGNATIYAQSGEVSRPWLAKYIDGGFYTKNQFIEEV